MRFSSAPILSRFVSDKMDRMEKADFNGVAVLGFPDELNFWGDGEVKSPLTAELILNGNMSLTSLLLLLFSGVKKFVQYLTIIVCLNTSSCLHTFSYLESMTIQ